MKAVFVLSTGRCGTMSLARLLNSHPRVIGLHEPLPRLVELSGEAYRTPEAPWAKFAIDVARRDYIQEANRQGKIYAETANRLTFFAHAIEDVFPGSLFIHLVRNPCSVIDSGVRRGWYQGHPWDKGRIRPLGGLWARRWVCLSPAQKVAWNWVETNRFILNFLSGLPSERKLFLQLERLEEMQPSLWRFLGVEDLRFPIQVTNRGTDTSVPRDYLEVLMGEAEQIMAACGYSPIMELEGSAHGA